MKQYPSISSNIHYGKPVYMFPKYDGSNVRAEWSRKNGFYKFGRRNGLLDDSNPTLAREVEPLVREIWEGPLTEVFKKERLDKATVFFEFWGPNSFAGYHAEEDHKLSILDISADKKGFLEPKSLLQILRPIDKVVELPEVIFYGNFTHEIQEQVSAGEFPGMSFEGVVAKGSYISPGMPLMFKWKSLNWLKKLKEKCSSEEEFEKLK